MKSRTQVPSSAFFTKIEPMEVRKSIKIFLLLSIITHVILMPTRIELPTSMNFQTGKSVKKQEKIIRLVLRRLGTNKDEIPNKVYVKNSQISSSQIVDLKSFSKELVKTKLAAPDQSKSEKLQLIPAKKTRKKFTIVKVSDNNNAIYNTVETDEGFKIQSTGKFETQTHTPILSNSRLQLNLDVPRGIEFDKLNDFEKQVYSFNKRVQKTFQSAIFRQFSKFIASNPHFPQVLLNRTEKLVGKLTYDKSGNLMRIKTLKGSYYENLQNAFLDSLQDVGILPNIPDLVLNEKNEMNLSITLSIN